MVPTNRKRQQVGGRDENRVDRQSYFGRCGVTTKDLWKPLIHFETKGVKKTNQR